jgi:hypothetical protein
MRAVEPDVGVLVDAVEPQLDALVAGKAELLAIPTDPADGVADRAVVLAVGRVERPDPAGRPGISGGISGTSTDGSAVAAPLVLVA